VDARRRHKCWAQPSRRRRFACVALAHAPPSQRVHSNRRRQRGSQIYRLFRLWRERRQRRATDVRQAGSALGQPIVINDRPATASWRSIAFMAANGDLWRCLGTSGSFTARPTSSSATFGRPPVSSTIVALAVPTASGVGDIKTLVPDKLNAALPGIAELACEGRRAGVAVICSGAESGSP
jgi:hypothetical protein